jgi:hypothetical protein
VFRRTLLGATTDVDRGGERSGESLILLGISARRMPEALVEWPSRCYRPRACAHAATVVRCPMRLANSTIATLFGAVRDGRSASAIRYEPPPADMPSQKLTS